MGSTDLVAVVVTDWVGSTATRSRLGEERADELQQIHDQLLRDAVAEHAGEVVKGSGDGLMAIFHSATDALGAAVAAQQRLGAYSLGPTAIAQVALRVGVSVGDVVHQDGDIFGTTVIEAARLEAAAQPGQILCTELVCLMSRGRGGLEFDTLGMLELKGLPEPVPVCGVRWTLAPAGVAAFPLPPELATAVASPFVGRDRELSSAVELALAAEQAHVLWLLGEPGIGKTRLATEVAAAAHAAGAVVLYGRCDEDVSAPFQPVVQALRWHVAQVDDPHLPTSLGADPGSLARLAPEIPTRVPQLMGVMSSPTESEQYRLFEAVRSWLAAVAASGLVLVVDDVHWADTPTLALLSHILRSHDPIRLLVVATARDTDPDCSDALSGLIDELARTGRSDQVRLEGLDTDQVGALVAAARVSTLDGRQLAERLATETAGNPLFVGAILAGLSRGDKSVRVGDLSTGDLHSAVRRRIRRLPAGVQELLQVAAVVGLEFTLSVIADAAELGEAESLALVEHAIRAGLVDEVGVDRFRFMHGLVRDGLAAELTASRRARVHGAIAASIERRHGESLDDYLRALAHHHANAQGSDSRARAFDYAVRSGDHAMHLSAFAAAADDYGYALELWEAFRSRPPGERCDLLLAKGTAERDAAEHRHALVTIRKAVQLGREIGDHERFAKAALAFEETSWRPGVSGQDQADFLLEALGYEHELPADLVVSMRESLARALHFAGRHAEARRIAEDALTRARVLGDPQLLARGITVLMQTGDPLRAEDLPTMIALAEEQRSLYAQLWNVDELGMPAATGAFAFLMLADRARFEEWHVQFRHLADRTKLPFYDAVIVSTQQVLAFLDADFDTAERLANASLEMAKSWGEEYSGVHGTQVFLIRREQDRLSELAPLVQMITRLNPSSAMWRPGLTVMLAEVGMVDDASEQLSWLAADRFRAVPEDNLYPASLCLLAEAASLLGTRVHADVLAELLAPWADVGVLFGHIVGCLGATSRYLGLLAYVAGRSDDAAAHFAHALDFNRRLGAPVWEAHTLADWAGLRLSNGDRVGARELAADARTLVHRHGLAAVGHQLDNLGLGDECAADTSTPRAYGPSS